MNSLVMGSYNSCLLVITFLNVYKILKNTL